MIRRNFFKAAAAFFSFPFLWKAKDPLPWSAMTMPKTGRECAKLTLRIDQDKNNNWTTNWEIVEADGTVTPFDPDDLAHRSQKINAAKPLPVVQDEGLRRFRLHIETHMT